MNYLQIGQSLVTECGAQNVTLTTMQNQSAEALRFVNWTNEAWTALQTERSDWNWLRSSFETGGGVSFVPNAGQTNIPFGTGAGTLGIPFASFGGKWVEKSFRCFLTSAGTASEIFIGGFLDFDELRNAYLYGAQRNARTRPVIMGIAPNQSLMAVPPSDGTYTLYGDFYMAPSAMSADADTPTNLPAQFHMLIVYKAMLEYADYEAAPEVMSRAQRKYDELFRELDNMKFGPTVTVGGALA